MDINFISLGKKSGGVGISPHRIAQGLESRGHNVSFNDKSLNFDIIHIHNAFAVRAVRKFRKLPIITHGHSVQADLKGGVFGYSLIKYPLIHALRNVYGASNHIIPVSDFAASEIRKMGVSTPMTTISNGIPLNEFPYTNGSERLKIREKLVRKLGLDSQRKIILGVGSLFPRKGILDFIKLARLVQGSQFIWIGKYQPIYPSLIMRWKMKKLPHNLKLLGFVDDLSEYYRGADLYLNLSFSETEGIPLLEAASSGIPIVARDIPPFQWLSHNVHCLKYSTFDQLVQYVNNEISQKLTKRARFQVEKLDLNNTILKIEQVYLKVLEEHM